MEEGITKFPYKIAQPNNKNGSSHPSSSSFQSSNINYSRKKEKNRTNLLNNQYQRSPPLRGEKEDC